MNRNEYDHATRVEIAKTDTAMALEHSPTPWKTYRQRDDYGIMAICPKTAKVHNGSMALANFYGPDAVANRQLFEMSPDMLAVLLDMLKACRECPEGEAARVLGEIEHKISEVVNK